MSGHPDRDAFRSANPLVRGEALRHLRSCARCRADLAAEDPASLFALLGALPVPASLLEEVSAAVAAGIRSGAAVELPVRRRGARLFSAWAAAAALAGILLVPLAIRREGVPPAVVAVSGPGPAAFRSGVEVLSSPGVPKVVDLSVGDAQLVMIFDREMDL